MPSLPVTIGVSVVVCTAVYYFFLSDSNAPVLHPVEYREFSLMKKTVLSHNAAIYRFQLPKQTQTIGLPIGQHITIQATIGGKEYARSYTPISSNSDKGYFDLLIKSYPNGNVSKHISNLQIGDRIRVRGPKGQFNYSPNMVEHLNMVAGGTGITPMYQILQAIAANPQDKTTATLLFGNVSSEDILLRDDLLALAESRPNIKVHFALDKPPADWTGKRGFVTADMMREVFSEPSSKAKLLICGPLPMVSAIKKHAVELGWEKGKAVSKLEDQVFAF